MTYNNAPQKGSYKKMNMKELVKQDNVQAMLKSTLQDKASQFATSLVSIVNSNQSLRNVDQMSVINSAMVAATLNLPINQNLGYMWLVPYKGQAQAQMGYKGYIQLAMRTGQYKALNAVAVCEGELGSWNALTEEVEYNPEKRKSDKVIGYIGYFRLLNGFEKTVYWTRDQIESHRMQFSKMSSGKTPSGVWQTNYDAMAMKTVLKSLLSKWGPMSTDMATAIEHDTDDQPDPIGTPDMEGANEQEFPDDQDSGRKEIDADEVTGNGNQKPKSKDPVEPKSPADESFADLLSGADF